MKKTYWWRTLILFAVFIFMLLDYFTYCERNIRVCFWSGDIYILQTMFHFAFPIGIVSALSFLLPDNIFKKWFKFAVSWIVLSLFFVSITPEYSGGWISLTPVREQVSIWMSSLFLIFSMVMIVIWTIQEKRKSVK